MDNPLLRQRLRPARVKPRLLGHWGTTPGLNPLHAHMNRVINEPDLNALYVTGPAHGGRGWWPTPTWRSTYTEVNSSIGQEEDAAAAQPGRQARPIAARSRQGGR